MTFTYDPSQLATSQMTQVRLMIGDTDEANPLFQDEEIDFTLTQQSTALGSAAACARSLAARFSRQVDSSIDGMRASFSQRAQQFLDLAFLLDARSTEQGASGMPYAGGISEADKRSEEGDSDRVPPQYTLGMTDNDLPVTPAGNETLTPKP